MGLGRKSVSLKPRPRFSQGLGYFGASDPQMEKSPSTKRYCVRGDLEEGEPETYAPVVAWSSVRLFLVLSLTLGWQTCSIDFSSAFVQANLTDPVWIHMPRASSLISQVTKGPAYDLLRASTVLSVAPLWYQHIREALLLQGLKQSATDSCLLYSKTIMIDLTDLGLEFTREGTFTDFLGIKFVKDEVANTVTLTQKGLIQKIIKATGLQDCNPNHTLLCKHALGLTLMENPWMSSGTTALLLECSCTCQQTQGQTSHLQNYCDSTGDLSLDCYVDADFAGLHGRDPDHSDTSAKSRTGYIITLGGCPILWKSQLQTEISLSTLESEYSALSASMRTLLPLRDLLGEICMELTLPPDFKSTIRCRVFEDNNGALLLATKQRITNRTKYFLVKWHFFWHHVRNGDVEVLKIATTDQLADYLTKGLNREVFERIRKLAQGW
ncbi:hypothetical protein MHU86_4663 [Fragilaria crotonensis]|nr:hypothetical protein MHU86_4663 [Fragilaria crotonensis]